LGDFITEGADLLQFHINLPSVTIQKWHLAAQASVLAISQSSTQRCYACGFENAVALP
jgi:hypothetical protein